jgi:hypothetical protein
MKRKHIAALGTLFAIASTAALAHSAPGPDFSPMKPRNFEEAQSQGYDTPSERATSAPGTAPVAPLPEDNRMLRAYEDSASPAPDTQPAPSPYADDAARRPRATVTQPTPRESTIGDGLFNRRGPNDFGA